MPYENNIVVHRKLPKGKWTIESKVPCEKCKKEYEILRAKYGEAMLDICARDEYAKHLKEKCTAEFEKLLWKERRATCRAKIRTDKKFGASENRDYHHSGSIYAIDNLLGELRAKIRELK